MKMIMIVIGTTLILASSGYAQFCDPPGEFVGITEYQVQSSGMSTNRIAFDELGGIHITWMHGSSSLPRNVYYNFRHEVDGWGETVIVSQSGGAGYPSMALNSDYGAAIAYHNVMNNYVLLAVDLFRGLGVFDYFDPPDMAPSGNRAFWPQVAVSANDDIHILMVEHTQEYGVYPSVIYSRSTNGGANWIDPMEVASVALLNGLITAAADGQVAIVYLHPVTSGEFSQVKNDIAYFLSADGREWDFSRPEFITNYEIDDLDIYCPWGVDAVFDTDGNLNVTWLTGNINDDGTFIDDVTQLWHYSAQTEAVGQIAEMTDTYLNCEVPAVSSQISMPSISADVQGNIEVVYVGYDDTDVSSDGFCVGDLYMVFGPDNGQQWYGPFNITETRSPDCQPGDCLSESFPSTAEIMADSVHLTYVMQKLGEGQDTVYYLPVEVPIQLGVDDREEIPRSFKLYGNYPNPFNSATTIRFEIEKDSYANLTIYDITGGKVATLVNGKTEAGWHSVDWDASDVASGVYYYSLKANGEESARKMTLLK